LTRPGLTRVVAAAVAGLAVAATLAAERAGDARGTASRPAASVVTAGDPRIVPAPVSLQRVVGPAFTLTPQTRLVVRDRRAAGVAEFTAALFRRSTGYPLRVTDGAAYGGHDVLFTLDGPASLGSEGYRLEVGRLGVRLSAHAAEGLFRGVQTLRQLLPPGIESGGVRPGPWPVPAVRIADRPRFAWRGAMLDVSRHFFGVDDVKRYLDLAALYKVNVLHLHLTDDQGWRLEIEKWPRLATVGGRTEVGGGTGGFYTQDEYAEIVRYAAERFVTVVPEIDVPGHTNAALNAYPELTCDGTAPPVHTGIDVGFSSLCVGKDVTYRFLDDVIGEVAALTPGRYLHIGGDEAYDTSRADYKAFMAHARQVVRAHGKQLIGWTQVATTPQSPDALAQYYHAAHGDDPRTKWAHAAAAQNMKLIMSPSARAYLDMKYTASDRLGTDWAGLVDVRTSYDWDPVTFISGLRPTDVQGVEAALWTETASTMAEVEYLAYPRLAGVAERGWSPEAGRSFAEYRPRLAAQGPRWTVLGVRFHRDPQVPWPAGTGGETTAPAGG
jgi:hexosaminidase